MTGCDDVQMALERARHGALVEAERPALDAHLATCATCRAWEASLGQVERALGAQAERALQHVGWERVEQTLRGRARRTLAAFGLSALNLLVMNLGLYALVGPEVIVGADVLGGLVAELAVLGVVFAAAVLWERRRQRLQPQGEALAWLRRDVAQTVRSVRQARWVLLACVGVLLGLAAWPGPLPLRPRLVLAAFSVVAGGTWAFVQWVKLPRLLREQADLADPGEA